MKIICVIFSCLGCFFSGIAVALMLSGIDTNTSLMKTTLVIIFVLGTFLGALGAIYAITGIRK